MDYGDSDSKSGYRYSEFRGPAAEQIQATGAPYPPVGFSRQKSSPFKRNGFGSILLYILLGPFGRGNKRWRTRSTRPRSELAGWVAQEEGLLMLFTIEITYGAIAI